MILSVILILALAGIAYFHYAQGMFGATISAIIAVTAAVLAVGYHENVINAFLGGAMGDYATAGSLIAIFALVYIIGRTITDMAIPGNIRLPLAIDRVGGVLMGVVAALFTTGIVALAAQALPFGASVGGHARFAIEGTREVAIFPPGGSRSQDMEVYDQLDEDTFQDEKRKKLWVPVDDIVVGFVQKLSAGGSLAGDRTLESVHPNYVDELFATRLGVQVGGKRTAFNGGKTPQVTVPDPGVFVVVTPDLTAKGNFMDAELNDLHLRDVVPKKGSAGDVQLVLRVMFTKDAADSDGNVRLAPAAVRLVANGTNYFPAGTLENGQLYANKVDDFLFINVKGSDAGADFVFFVPPRDVIAGGFDPKAAAGAAAANAKDAKDAAPKVIDGVFVEVKRLARVDLSGRAVLTSVPKSENLAVERKPKLLEDKKKKGAPAAGETPAPAEPAPAAPAPAAPAPAPAPAADPKKNPLGAIKENTQQKNDLINKSGQ